MQNILLARGEHGLHASGILDVRESVLGAGPHLARVHAIDEVPIETLADVEEFFRIGVEADFFVVLDDREAENLFVLLRRDRGESFLHEKSIGDSDRMLDVEEQSAVPIPNDVLLFFDVGEEILHC